jgi:hypothetical protein
MIQYNYNRHRYSQITYILCPGDSHEMFRGARVALDDGWGLGLEPVEPRQEERRPGAQRMARGMARKIRDTLS